MQDSIISKLDNEAVWNEFLKKKADNSHLSKRELKDLGRYVAKKEYLEPAVEIRENRRFPHADAFYIHRPGKKKRLVFHFSRKYNYILKLMDSLLQKYDSVLCSNLYSFRSRYSVKRAIERIIRRKGLEKLYSYKVDISDYFNSIDVDMMVNDVNAVMEDDPETAAMIEAILRDPYVIYEGKEVIMKKGVMAGIPISGWLANLYMSQMDRWFHDHRILYARYADDIIVFADTQEKITAYENKIKEFLEAGKMKVNPRKEFRTLPGEPWEFLGFTYTDNRVDLSKEAEKKIKSKIRILAHRLYKWRLKKHAPVKGTIKAFLREANYMIYANTDSGNITWSRWYFPVLTTDRTLKKVDEYLLQYARYIQSGRFTKKNYNLRYEKLQELGFESLVNNFWDLKAGRSGYLTNLMEAQQTNAAEVKKNNADLVNDPEKLSQLEIKKRGRKKQKEKTDNAVKPKKERTKRNGKTGKEEGEKEIEKTGAEEKTS